MRRVQGIDDHRSMAIEPSDHGQVFLIIGSDEPGIIVDGAELLRAVAATVREAYARAGGES